MVALYAEAPAAQPWIGAGEVPLASWVKSVQVRRRDEPLRQAADAEAPRRGSAVPGEFLPIFATRRGPGCAERWALVGPSAWVCSAHVSFSSKLPSPEQRGRSYSEDGLPYRYYFVGSDGSLAYRRFEAADETAPDVELEPGFSVAVVRQRARHGETYVKSTDDMWIPLRDLVPVRASSFRGVMLDGSLDVGWVFTDGATVYKRPGAQKSGSRARLERITILERSQRHGSTWFRIADDAWIRERDVRTPSQAELPAELRPNERWIDVDTSSQVLTAYEGSRAVFATLVSTGRGAKGTAEATPEGRFRIWVKVVTINMDNLEDEEASRYYSMQAVPWVMFFKGGFGLHGTYWHSSFGRTRSHGCVNLAPRDAEWLFEFASPHLPASWSAVHPTAHELGTLVSVR